MMGAAPLPAVLWGSRLQPAQMLLTLRHFRTLGEWNCRPSAAPILRPTSERLGAAASRAPASPARSWRLSKALVHRRWGPWRSPAAPQLHADAGPAAPAAVPAARSIQPGEVHIWWLDPATVPADGAELERCAQLLTEEELHECRSSPDPAVRRERLLARAHTRSVLAGYLAGAPHPRSLLFERNDHGKPHLLWPTATPAGHALRFNLTHTPSLIGLAVTVEALVGLDVEAAERRTRGDPMRLARRRFSDREIADLEACPEGASRAAYFLQLWTLKEAYVKALGRGISAAPGLRSFSFQLQPPGLLEEQAGAYGGAVQQQQPSQEQQQQQHGADSPVASSSSTNNGSDSGAGPHAASIRFHSAAGDERRWQFALLQPAPSHMAALCVECPAGSAGEGGSLDSSSGGSDCGRSLSTTTSSLDCSPGSLRVLAFQGMPEAFVSSSSSSSSDGGSECTAQPLDPQFLAQGVYCP